MKKQLSLFFIGFCSLMLAQNKPEQAQQPKVSKLAIAQARTLLRAGNKQFEAKNYGEAQALYKRALDKNAAYGKASFNMGNAMYLQKNYKDALPQFELDAKLATSKIDKAEANHNIGNLQMEEKQYSKAVEAYKEALRNNPKDDDTRYNLALAQKLLDKQLKNQDKNKDKDKDKDKKDNKDQKNQDQKNQKDKGGNDKDKDKDKNNKDQDKKDPNKDQDKNNPNKNDKSQQKQQPKEGQMSPDKMQQLLEAMNNEEKKTQKKMNAKRVKGDKTKLEKDW
ncbi:MAG: hypothetical protein AUJ53_02680 [Flavobacteriaceae bacterium CG1_02_35_72]|nr:MAG: hypothetical protein AUJ53_02680 [Flavobacteriaceae bacterium CG1_02_35_72]